MVDNVSSLESVDRDITLIKILTIKILFHFKIFLTINCVINR